MNGPTILRRLAARRAARRARRHRDHRPPTTRQLVATGLAAALLFAAWVGSGDNDDDRRRTAFAEAETVPVGPLWVDRGIPRGWRHDISGARAAAVGFVRATETIARAGDLERRDLLDLIVADSFDPAERMRVLDALDDLHDDIARTGLSVDDLLWRDYPLAVTSTPAPDDLVRGGSGPLDRVEVQVWSVTVAGVLGGGPPAAVWETSEITLVWEEDDWQVQSWTRTTAPTPADAPAVDVSGVDEFEAVFGWSRADEVGAG